MNSHTNKHLGLVRTDDGKPTEAVKKSTQVGRRTAYALMEVGLCGLNDISPHISKTLISTYITPAVLYGLEAVH